MGLFNGFSLMVIAEVIQLVVYICFKLIQNKTEQPNLNSLLDLAYSYFEATTIHGMKYIHKTPAKLGKLVWTIIVISFLGAGLVIAALTFFGYKDNPIIRQLNPVGNHVTSFQFPTITIWPIQYNDRWNFQRTILNLDPIRDNSTNEFLPRKYDEFKHFFEVFMTHEWINDKQFSFMTQQEKETFNNLLPAMILQRDIDDYIKTISYNVLNNDLAFLNTKQIPFTDDEHMRLYEINMNVFTKAHSIFLPDVNSSNVNISFFATNQSLQINPVAKQHICQGFFLHSIYPNEGEAFHHSALECDHYIAGQYFYILVPMFYQFKTVGPIILSRSNYSLLKFS